MKNNTFCIFSGYIKEIHHPQQTISIQIGTCEFANHYTNERCLLCPNRIKLEDEVRNSKAENYAVSIMFNGDNYPVIA